jgi:uncharacterized protein YkwD
MTLSILVLALAASSICSTPTSLPVERAVCEITNTEREKSSEVPLQLDAHLSDIARNFAADMRARKYFSHVTPEGATMQSRLKNGSVIYRYAGENIAMGYRDAQYVMDGWMNSPGHRRNILTEQFRKIGVGVSGDYYVQVFTN